MRVEPYARGRCHSSNYWELTQILLSNVDGSNPIAVIAPVALGTAKHAAFHLAAHIATVRTGTARIVFILQGDLHAQPLSFVAELEPYRTM